MIKHTVAYGQHTEPYVSGFISLDMTVERDQWTEAALAALIENGEAGVKVERLARTLKVTKGSFYWHFKNREDLLRETAASWERKQRAYAQTLADADHANPEERLRALLRFVEEKDPSSDVAIRLWARKAPWVDQLVAGIDELRLSYCRRVFAELGFAPPEAALRGQQVYYRQVAEQTLSYRPRSSGDTRERWFRWLSRRED